MDLQHSQWSLTLIDGYADLPPRPTLCRLQADAGSTKQLGGHQPCNRRVILFTLHGMAGFTCRFRSKDELHTFYFDFVFAVHFVFKSFAFFSFCLQRITSISVDGQAFIYPCSIGRKHYNVCNRGTHRQTSQMDAIRANFIGVIHSSRNHIFIIFLRVINKIKDR